MGARAARPYPMTPEEADHDTHDTGTFLVIALVFWSSRDFLKQRTLRKTCPTGCGIRSIGTAAEKSLCW